MVERFGAEIHFLHLRNVTRETRGNAGSFFEAEHLDGDTDMVALIAAVLREEARRRAEGRADAQIPMRPDHGQDILDDLEARRPAGLPDHRPAQGARRTARRRARADRHRRLPISLGDGFLHPDRLFPAEPALRAIARDLHAAVRDLPIVSPHGHTDPAWFANDTPFANAAELLVMPDHYLFRMLNSVGVSHDALGLPRPGLSADPRETWRTFARHYHLFRGTPSRLWVDHAMSAVLGCPEPLTPANADALYDHIGARLALPEFHPRALLDRFGIETIATTEGALDPLTHHRKLLADGWIGRVRTTYRPDAVTDPEAPGFADNLLRLGETHRHR